MIDRHRLNQFLQKKYDAAADKMKQAEESEAAHQAPGQQPEAEEHKEETIEALAGVCQPDAEQPIRETFDPRSPSPIQGQVDVANILSDSNSNGFGQARH